MRSGDKTPWKKIKMNFLASTHPDLEAGTASVSNIVNDSTFNLEYALENIQERQNSHLKIKPFIQGMDIESNNKQSIGLRHKQTTLNKGKVIFEYANPNKTSIIRTLKIAVIVYDIESPGVLYADGIIDQNFVESKLTMDIPRHGIE